MPYNEDDRRQGGTDGSRRTPRHVQPQGSGGQHPQQGRRPQQAGQRAAQGGQAHRAAGSQSQQGHRPAGVRAQQGQRPAGARPADPRAQRPAGRRPAPTGYQGQGARPHAQQPHAAQQGAPRSAQPRQTGARQAQQPYGQPAQGYGARPAQQGGYAQPMNYGANPYAARGQGYDPFSSDPHSVGYDGAGHEVYRVRRKRKSHRGLKIAVAVIAVVVILVAAVGVSGFTLLNSARTVKADADQVLSLAGGMADKAMAGDMQGLSSDAQQVASLASSMHSETDSPLWAVASAIPVYGSDISAARTLVSAFDDVAGNALVPLANSLQGVSLDTMMSDGRINVETFQTLATSLSDVAPVIQGASDQIDSIGETHIDQITDLVSTAKGAMGSLSGAVSAANKFAPVIPQMLGAGGQSRNYLIIAMTNSEIRACGGFPGAQGLLTVTDGNISLGDFQKVQWSRENPVPVSDEAYALFQGPEFSGEAMTVSSGDAPYDPDFPVTAGRLVQFWTNNFGGTVDGVIALDPVLLQYILGVTGGVTSPDGTTVDGTNAVKYLMSDVYWIYNGQTDYQDAIFSEVAGAAFDKIVSSLGDLDPTALMNAMARGVDEGRLLVWMQNPDEEQAAIDLGVSGEILTDPATAQLGVYVNDYSFTKSEYYLDFDTVVGESSQNDDGSTTYHMVTTLTNTMTSDIEAQLPGYLRAGNSKALSDGDLMLRTYLYAPAGGSVADVSASGDADISLRDGSYDGIQVTWGEVHLLPGETLTLTYTVTTSPEAGDVPLDVRSTPTVQNVRG